MNIIPIKWSFNFHPLMHILQITGSCDVANCENILFNHIVFLMEKANACFNAICISDEPPQLSTSCISISCKLQFKCKEDAEGFLKYVKNSHPST